MKLLKLTYFFILIYILSAFIVPKKLALSKQENNDKTVKIGLLISNKKNNEATYAVEMAINQANKKGGINGIPFQLITRSMEGPWGTGSKQAVDLVFNENVWAIIGSHDGRNAHLVEQVIAKTHVVFLSAWATDPTLSQAYVPWYFSCVPNAIEQSKTLINAIYNKSKINNIAIISDKHYDAKIEVENLLKEIKLAGKSEPILIYYNSPTMDFKMIANKIQQNKIQGIVLFGKSSNSINLINQLQQQKITTPIFATFALLKDNDINDEKFKYFNKVSVVSPENQLNSKLLNFKNKYFKKFGKMPGTEALYAYDATNIIIDAIKHSWPNREKIQKNVSTIHFEGVTGSIRFDERGNHVGAINLIETKKGIPEKIKK